MTTNDERLLAIIAKYPGLDAIALKGKGFRPQVHGSLRDAERRGLLTYVNGGWYVKRDTGEITGIDDATDLTAARRVVRNMGMESILECTRSSNAADLLYALWDHCCYGDPNVDEEIVTAIVAEYNHFVTQAEEYDEPHQSPLANDYD